MGVAFQKAGNILIHFEAPGSMRKIDCQNNFHVTVMNMAAQKSKRLKRNLNPPLICFLFIHPVCGDLFN